MYSNPIVNKLLTIIGIYGCVIGTSLLKNDLFLVETDFWWYFISMCLFYQIVGLIVEHVVTCNPWLMDKLAPHAKKQFKTIEDISFMSRSEINALIHSSISALVAFYLVIHESPLHEDHLFGVTFLSQLHGVHTSAYFFSDLVSIFQRPISTFGYFEKVILAHHILGCIGFSMAAYGVGTFYAALILMAEISNPPLAIRWFLLTFNQAATISFSVAENTFIVLFYAVRIFLAYFWITPIVYDDLASLALGGKINDKFPLYSGQASSSYVQTVAASVCTLLIVFHLINSFFVYDMVVKWLVKKRKGKVEDCKLLLESESEE